jgi:hypothetical protein
MTRPTLLRVVGDGPVSDIVEISTHDDGANDALHSALSGTDVSVWPVLDRLAADGWVLVRSGEAPVLASRRPVLTTAGTHDEIIDELTLRSLAQIEDPIGPSDDTTAASMGRLVARGHARFIEGTQLCRITPSGLAAGQEQGR